jgi:FixJ family two-component response regulator
MVFSQDSVVICVDDDESILTALSVQLQKLVDTEKVLVEYFLNPEDALASIPEIINLKIKVIFVLTDYQMPRMTGAEFLKKLKSVYPDIHCIMLSGQANDEIVENLISQNLLDYFISKPWSEGQLLEKIRLIVPADKLV